MTFLHAVAADLMEESSAPDRQSRGLIDGFELLGDLDGDGKEEIVLAFWDASGGSGVFNYLVILDLANDKISSHSIFVGDRVQILGGEIEGNKIVVNLVEHADTDPACCPAQKAIRTWAYEKDGNFREMPAKLTGRLSVEDVGGTEWILTMLNGEAVPEDLQISLTYEDGQIKGNAGCNSYFSDMKDREDAGGSVKLGPVGSTRKACPDEVMHLEGSYLQSLGNTTSFSLVGRQLVLSWNSADQSGALIFIPGRKVE
ncbi:META domain-containing protein [Thiolapillus sp.]